MTIKRAIIINVIGKYSAVIFQLVFNAILSRLLTPAEFGIVTVMNIFVVFFELFSDLGIGTAVIQNIDLNERDIQSIFLFTSILGIAFAFGFVLLSYGISWFYNNKVYISLGMIFSISVLFTSLNVVPDALLMKEKKFILVNLRTVIICIVSYSIAILLAIHGYSYYSLVLRIVIMKILLFVWNISNVKLSHKMKIEVESIKKISKYSFYQFMASLLNYFQRNLDNLLVGRCMGEEQLGYYDKSYTLMRYPISYLANVITPVLHPILAEHQGAPKYIFNKYLKIVEILSVVAIFITGIFISSSNEIIYIMFGLQWERAIEPFRIISLSIWPQMLTGTVGCIMQSLGDTKSLFKICTHSIGISIAGICIGVLSGSINYLAMCIVVIYWIHFFIYFYIMMKHGFKSKLSIFLRAIHLDLILLICISICAIIIFKFIKLKSLILSLIIKFCIITFLYIILLFVTNKSRNIINLLKHR